MAKPKHMTLVFCTGVTLFVSLIAIIPVHAAIITVPTDPDLQPGDSYRLAFVTDGTNIAYFSEVGFYDTIVRSRANQSELPGESSGVEWKAIVATVDDPNVYINTATDPSPSGANGVPIYNLAGEKVAADYDDLWDGSLLNPIAVSQSGIDTRFADSDWIVWTGFCYTGADADCTPLYKLGGNSGDPAGTGISDRTNGTWTWANVSDNANTEIYHLYAISSPLQVVPVPAAIWLLGSGLVALLALRRKGRKE